jgi:hypothetical protein
MLAKWQVTGIDLAGVVNFHTPTLLRWNDEFAGKQQELSVQIA